MHMSEELELELTYLVKSLPDGLAACESEDVLDIYVPKSAVHPTLRIRKSGGKTVITKKEPKDGGDSSEQVENTIPLTAGEYEDLSKIEGKRVRKTRYRYNYNGRIAEIAVFQDGLKGLVLVDFEFKDRKSKQAFKMPEFCLANVTHEMFLAGGMLCGKRYGDIEGELAKFSYRKLDTASLL
jgi:CYTH domain-containing protein